MGITIIKDTITRRNKAFEKICLMTQAEVKKYMSDFLVKAGRSTVEGDGYIFSKGTVPVLLIAHMDTVHKETPKEIIYANGTISSPQGIGGDDRCGVYMISRLIRDTDCSVLLVEDEEIGCIGSKKFSQTQLAKELEGKFNCLIELDRKGSTDAVFYDCDNPEFTKVVTKSFWKEETGSYTDIVELSPVLDCASVNLSCGYYKQHTVDEYVVLSEMEKSITEALRLIKRIVKANKQFEYIERVTYGRWYDKWDSYGYGGYYYGKSDIKYYDIEYFDPTQDNIQYDWADGFSMEEAIGTFFMNHPNIPFANIVEIIEDTEGTVYINEELFDQIVVTDIEEKAN